MYIANPEEFDKEWFTRNQQYPLRSDLSTKAFYTQLYYFFNGKRFSYPASLFLRERQRKSAGSPLIGASFVYNQIDADSSLLPGPLQSQYPEKSDLLRYRSYSYAINGGYIYTLILKKYFFITASLQPGIALKNTSNNTKEGQWANEPLKIDWQGDGQVTVGYNNERYYGGLSYNLLFFSNRLQKEGNLESYYTYIRFLVRKRFNFRPGGVLRKVPGF